MPTPFSLGPTNKLPKYICTPSRSLCFGFGRIFSRLWPPTSPSSLLLGICLYLTWLSYVIPCPSTERVHPTRLGTEETTLLSFIHSLHQLVIQSPREIRHGSGFLFWFTPRARNSGGFVELEVGFQFKNFKEQLFPSPHLSTKLCREIWVCRV